MESGAVKRNPLLSMSIHSLENEVERLAGVVHDICEHLNLALSPVKLTEKELPVNTIEAKANRINELAGSINYNSTELMRALEIIRMI